MLRGALLLRLIEDCESLLLSGFISQQDMARLLTRQRWLRTGIPPTAVNLLTKVNDHQKINTLDYHVWGVMLEHYKTFHHQRKNTDGLKKVLQLIWNQLPQDSVDKTILSFTKKDIGLV